MAEETARVVEGDSAVISPSLPQGMMAPWPKGVSGNPLGRPTEEDRLICKVLRRHPNIGNEAADELARILRTGDHKHWMAALREWLDRTEGTVQQSTHHHVSTDRAIVTHAGPVHPPELPGAEPPAAAGPEGEPP